MLSMKDKKIPDATISRLCIYLRELTELAKINIATISSSELGERINISDAQIRRDLGYFGQFGVTGSGYNIIELKSALQKILGKDRVLNVVVVGAGHLGTALISYPRFKEHGLNIIAAFDISSKKIGKKINNIDILDIKELSKEMKKRNVAIGIVAVPTENAQEVVNTMVNAGVSCILNFAPAALNVPENVKLKSLDLSQELETLSYFCS